MLMHQRIFGRLLLALYLFLSHNEVQGEIKLSKSKDLEIEKQLKLLVKPAVKTIKTVYGDTYDCVDFYKQPAFDHPSLKNHNFHPQMKPTLARTKQNSKNSSTSPSSRIWLEGKGCPSGTVPIRRITKEDLMRQRNMPPPEGVTVDAQSATTNNNSGPEGIYSYSGGYKVAIANMGNNPHNEYGGAGMTVSIWDPYVEGQQSSACRLKIQKGADVIQVGWRTDTTLYPDDQPRMFIHFQAGDTHCFNTLCPGFVIVNTDTPIDKRYVGVQRPGYNPLYEDTMSLSRDLDKGDWWLFVGQDKVPIGFWPQRLFTSLASLATNVEWGGVVYSSPGVPEPGMGSGYPFAQDIRYDAYGRELIILNDKGETIGVDPTITHSDNPNNYQAKRLMFYWHGKPMYYLLYGGTSE